MPVIGQGNEPLLETKEKAASKVPAMRQAAPNPSKQSVGAGLRRRVHWIVIAVVNCPHPQWQQGNWMATQCIYIYRRLSV